MAPGHRSILVKPSHILTKEQCLHLGAVVHNPDEYLIRTILVHELLKLIRESEGFDRLSLLLCELPPPLNLCHLKPLPSSCLGGLHFSLGRLDFGLQRFDLLSSLSQSFLCVHLGGFGSFLGLRGFQSPLLGSLCLSHGLSLGISRLL